MPPAERRALLLLLGLAVAGQGVRLLAAAPNAAPGAVQLLSDHPASSLGAHRDSARLAGRPLAPGERIDVDRATAAELARLPRVGVSLARTIVADREKRGPFGNISGLDRVPGIGPGLLARLQEHVSFSGTPRSPVNGPSLAQRGTPALAEARIGARDDTPEPPINLNTASAAVLVKLPGIGPVRAQRIVAYREAHGPFPSLEAVGTVPGVGARVVARLGKHAAVW